MAIEDRTVKFAKEVDDVALLFPKIVKAIKSGQGIVELSAGLFQDLVTAVQGVDQIGQELKDNRQVVLETLGYRTGELADAFL